MSFFRHEEIYRPMDVGNVPGWPYPIKTNRTASPIRGRRNQADAVATKCVDANTVDVI